MWLQQMQSILGFQLACWRAPGGWGSWEETPLVRNLIILMADVKWFLGGCYFFLFSFCMFAFAEYLSMLSTNHCWVQHLGTFSIVFLCSLAYILSEKGGGHCLLVSQQGHESHRWKRPSCWSLSPLQEQGISCILDKITGPRTSIRTH